GNRNHRRAAFVHSVKAIFWRKLPLQDVRRILNFAAPGAGQIAAEQGLKHKNERILIAPGHLLPDHITCHRPPLRNANAHYSLSFIRMRPSFSCWRPLAHHACDWNLQFATAITKSCGGSLISAGDEEKLRAKKLIANSCLMAINQAQLIDLLTEYRRENWKG